MRSLGNEKLQLCAALGLRCLRYGTLLRSEGATEPEIFVICLASVLNSRL